MSGDADWRQTACRETGHSVGLSHTDNDCMGSNSSQQQYSAHHQSHINNDR